MNDRDLQGKSLFAIFQRASHVRKTLFHYQMSSSYRRGYNYRIIFLIEKNKETNEEEIVLLNVGSHDEVY